MKNLNVLLMIAATALFSLNSMAGNTNDTTVCKSLALQTVANKISANASQIKYLGGSLIGDGEFAVSVHVVTFSESNQKAPVGFLVKIKTDSVDVCDVTAGNVQLEIL